MKGNRAIELLIVLYLFIRRNQVMNDRLNNEAQRSAYDRRRFMQLVGGMTAGGLLLAACGGTDTTQLTKVPPSTTLAQKDVEATIAASTGKTYFPGTGGVPDAYTAPPPLLQSVQYVPGRGGNVT